jgi:ribonuclease R
MQVEREVVSFYATLLMKDRVGEEFEATVSGLTEFGCFVELDEEHVEGLVKLEAIGFGGKLDKLTHALVFPDGRRVRVGQQCRVRLASVSPERRQMDFEPLEIAGKRVVGRERSQRPVGTREQAPRFEEKRRRFVREGQREEAAPSKADRKRWKAERGPASSEKPARPAPRKEAPEQAGGTQRRRFVVRPADQAEHAPRVELRASSWRSEPPPLAEGDPLAAFMADAPPLAPPPGFDRLRALASRRGRAEGSRQHAEAPGPMRDRPEHKARSSGKKTSGVKPVARRKSAKGGGKPPKSGGKFKPGRRKR